MSVWSGIRPLAVCSVLFAFAQFAPAQTKVAVINLQKAVFDSAETCRLKPLATTSPAFWSSAFVPGSMTFAVVGAGGTMSTQTGASAA